MSAILPWAPIDLAGRLALLSLIVSTAAAQAPRPREADVSTIDGIVAAYYDVISGPAGQARDWRRDSSLYIADVRFVSMGFENGRPVPNVMDHGSYARQSDPFFQRNGFYEREIHRETRRFGSIAHVFSTYESRNTPDGPVIARGINSLNLFWDGTRWWIANATWDEERTAAPIPPEFLPPGPSESDPAEVARDFLGAIRERRWADAVRLMDLRRFESFRQSSAASARLNRRARPSTVEEMTERIMKADPGMPRDLAEYQARQRVRSQASFAEELLSRDFARVNSPEELEALPLTEAAVRWLEARDPYTTFMDRLGRFGPAAGCDTTRLAQGDPVAGDQLALANDVLAVAVDSSGRGYAVIELGTAALLTGRPELLSLVNTPTGWRVLWTEGMPISSPGLAGFSCRRP